MLPDIGEKVLRAETSQRNTYLLTDFLLFILAGMLLLLWKDNADSAWRWIFLVSGCLFVFFGFLRLIVDLTDFSTSITLSHKGIYVRNIWGQTGMRWDEIIDAAISELSQRIEPERTERQIVLWSNGAQLSIIARVLTKENERLLIETIKQRLKNRRISVTEFTQR